MGNSRRISEIINYYGKGVAPKYVVESSIIVLNQKCVRNNKIDYKFAQYIADDKQYAETKFLKVGDILVNSTGQGTAGRVAFVASLPDEKRVIVDSHILVLRVENFVEAQCLNYNLFFIEKTLQSFMDGSTGQGEFDKIRLFNIKVNYPKDSVTQQKIASVLSTLDDKIELNNKINDNLEQMAKTLYDYWFVQFDFPNAEGKPYKSSGGEMVYNDVLKREIPKGWEVKTVSELGKTGSGGTPLSTNSDYYENGNIPWINSGETNNPFIISTKNYITELGMKSSSAKLFPENSLLMAMYGATAGKVSFLKIRATTNQAICAIIPNIEEYTYLLKFRLESMYKYLINLSTGSARDNLSQDKIKNIQIINPEGDVLRKFHLFVDGLYEKYYNNSQQNQELASLRDWLLPMLMNGQIKVE